MVTAAKDKAKPSKLYRKAFLAFSRFLSFDPEDMYIIPEMTKVTIEIEKATLIA
jgi:hypothetical protein